MLQFGTACRYADAGALSAHIPFGHLWPDIRWSIYALPSIVRVVTVVQSQSVVRDMYSPAIKRGSIMISRASGKHGKRERERERKFGKGRQTHICIILYHQSCCSLVNVSYLFMQHTNLVISKYVQPDLNLPEHQTE